MLKTDQKDLFLARLQRQIHENGVYTLGNTPKDLAWHPNETATRWFLVVRLKTSPELSKLLGICNGVAKEFKQPQLYATSRKDDKEGDQFHLSIAWSLRPPATDNPSVSAPKAGPSEAGIPYERLERLCSLQVSFSEVKVRVGQDVHVVRLK